MPKNKKYISPLYWTEIKEICLSIKCKLFLRTYAEIENKIGCKNGYLSSFKNKGKVLPQKWSLELIALYELGVKYERKNNLFKKRESNKPKFSRLKEILNRNHF